MYKPKNIDEFCLCGEIIDPATKMRAIHFQSLHFEGEQKTLLEREKLDHAK